MGYCAKTWLVRAPRYTALWSRRGIRSRVFRHASEPSDPTCVCARTTHCGEARRPRRETPRCVGPQMRYSVRVAPILHYMQHNAAPYQRSERDAPRQDAEMGRRGDGVSGARSNRYALRDRGLTQSVSTAPGQRFVRAAGTRSRDLVPTYLGIRREPCQRER